MDKYFDMITYLDTTTDTRSEVLKKLSSFAALKFKSEDIILINTNNNKKFISAQSIIVSVLEHAKKRSRIGLNDFEDLYNLVYQNFIAPIEFNVNKKEENGKEDIFVPNHKKN